MLRMKRKLEMKKMYALRSTFDDQISNENMTIRDYYYYYYRL